MNVPTRAILTETVYATKGNQSIIVRRYSGQISEGFKTLYEPRPAVWVAYSPSEGAGWVRRWTGRNLPALERVWPLMIESYRTTGWTVEVKRPHDP